MRRAAFVLRVTFMAALLVAPVAAAATDVAPLSVESFFRRPAYGGATLSPNGRYIAVMAPVGDRRGLIVVDRFLAKYLAPAAAAK